MKSELQAGGNYLPVRAVADGEVVFVHAPTTPDTDVMHPLNYNPFNDGTPSPAWTSDGFVVIRHTTEIGATGTAPTEVTYFSAYMHLSHLANCPKRNTPWKAGDASYRKDELGAPGQIYGHGGQIHFEISCNEANLGQFVPRAPAWADPLAPTAPTADGRTDSVFGSMYIYLPAGTPTSATPPKHHLRRESGERGGASAASDHFVPDTLQQPQWVQVTYDSDSASPQKGSVTLYSYAISGEPIGAHCNVPDFEYDLYAKATERHNSLDAATQALSSPSGWYEFPRFGRNLGPDRLPAHVAHWREIPTATGKVWADLNYLGTFKFSEADFPAFKGWNCFDDDGSPSDQRCDSLHMKTLIRDPDPSNDRRMEPEQLARRLGEPLVRAKLRRAICRFPSKWDRNTVFVEVMRTCGWLQLSELTQLIPRVYGVTNTRLTSIGWATARARFRPFAIDLNKTFRKYLITTAARQTHFLAQTYIETAMWATMEEFGRAHQQRRANGTPYWPAPAMEYYQAFYGRGIMQLTWAGNYASYGSYRPIPDIAVPHVFNDSRITQTSLHYWQDPRNRQGVVVERPRQWAPRFDPVVISTNTYNACDSGCHYWVSKNVGQHQININRACDLGITTGAVGRVSVLVNGGVFGYSERQGFAAFVDRYRGDTAEASSSTTMQFTSRNTVGTCYVDFTPQRP